MVRRSPSPDLDAARHFVQQEDRSRAWFFVGREKEIRNVETVLSEALSECQAGGSLFGATRLIRGAPGAGKTALLTHLRERWPADGRAGEPRALLVDRQRLANPTGLVFDIAECLDAEKARAFRQTETRGREVTLGVGPLAGGGTQATATSPPPADLSELRRLFPPETWERPICLMVDEVQNLRPEEGRILESLHAASDGLPIVPVLAGLSNAQDVLAREGRISRLGSGAAHTLGCLEAGLPAEAVRRMLDRFGIEAAEDEAERWAGLLERESDGWPQHLRNGMRALAEESIATGGRLAAVDEAAVLARARQWREETYRARCSPEMRRAAPLVGAVMAALPEEGLEEYRIVDLIAAEAGRREGSGWALPEGFSARQFLDHLVHRGALQQQPDDRLACPIPSFRRFLMQDRTPPA